MTIPERKQLRILNERVVALEKENSELKALLNVPTIKETKEHGETQKESQESQTEETQISEEGESGQESSKNA